MSQEVLGLLGTFQKVPEDVPEAKPLKISVLLGTSQEVPEARPLEVAVPKVPRSAGLLGTTQEVS